MAVFFNRSDPTALTGVRFVFQSIVFLFVSVSMGAVSVVRFVPMFPALGAAPWGVEAHPQIPFLLAGTEGKFRFALNADEDFIVHVRYFPIF